MKKIFFLYFFIAVNLFSIVARDAMIDLRQIKADNFIKFIQYLQWPSDKDITNSYIKLGYVTDDIKEFKVSISNFIRPAYLPSESQFNGIIALTNFIDGNDCLLLSYMSTDNRIVRIIDSKQLYILVDIRNDNKDKVIDSKIQLSNVIKKVAFKFFMIPEKYYNEGMNNYIQTGYIRERYGDVKYDNRDFEIGTLADKYGELPDKWYKHIRWWSNNDKILFVILKNNLNISEVASMPQDAMLPRKFKLSQRDNKY